MGRGELLEANGLAVWVEAEAGSYQTVPQAGQSWCPEGHLAIQPHEYLRGAQAKSGTTAGWAAFHGPAVNC